MKINNIRFMSRGRWKHLTNIAAMLVCVFVVAGSVKAEASAAYEPLSGDAIVKDWEFTSALKPGIHGLLADWDKDANSGRGDLTVGMDLAAGNITMKFGTHVTVKFPAAYISYNGTEYDIFMKLTPCEVGTTAQGTLVNNATTEITWDNSAGNMVSTKGTEPDTYIQFKYGEMNFDYELWLVQSPKDGTVTTIESSDEKNELFIAGNCWMAENTSVDSQNWGEACRPYSIDGKLYSNDNLSYRKRGSSATTNHEWKYDTNNSWWYSTNRYNTNNNYTFVIGYGYSDSDNTTNKHSVKSGYANKPGNGGLFELLMGYRTRRVIYAAQPGDDGFKRDEMTDGYTGKDSNETLDLIGKIENYLEDSNLATQPSGVTVYVPDDTDRSAKIDIGRKFSHWTTAQAVTLNNGTVIAKDSIITEEEIKRIKVTGNEDWPDIVFYAHTMPDDKVSLTFHKNLNGIPGADILGVQDNMVIKTDSVEGTPTKDEDPNKPGTGIPLYKPNQIVKGNDNLYYKFLGWYEDEGGNNPFTFGSGLEANKHIYAKWTEVPAPTTPTPTPTPSNDDPAPAGGPIKVEFVTPIGNTPPTQIKNVGDKANDPGAPVDPATLKPGTVINGYRFDGWFLDQGYTKPYNFDTKLTTSIKLYAKWVRVSPKTGDVPVASVYYLLGLMALAGAGVVITKARRVNK